MRLNKKLREEIVDNAFKASGITESRKDLGRKMAELADEIRLDHLGGKALEQNMLAVEAEIKLLLEKRGIPEDLREFSGFKRSTYCYVKFAEESSEPVNYNGALSFKYSGDYGQVYVSIPGVDGRGRLLERGTTAKYDANHEFTLRYRKIKDEAIELDKKERNLRIEVAAFNTVESLLEHWPESEPLIPKNVAAASKPMPIAVRVDCLNKMIGLPKE